ncbi:MAG: GPW/gp25 family protein [Rhizobiaceae bacterium]|nr:GPW/gp25 family protein [Rhizobiaceae bacterium]
MTQFGMDRHSGRWISGWASVAQAIEVLLTTRYFERVLREYVGSPLPAMLGETANLETVSKFRWAIAITILLFEPRFLPTQIAMTDLGRPGNSSWIIRGKYRPRAHLGDLTEAGEVTLTIGASGAGQIVAG